jgi:hypothetical protein
VLWNWNDGPVAEYIDIIRYLGPPLPATVDVIEEDLFPSKRRACRGTDRRLRFEPIFFCTAAPDSNDPAHSASVPILQLHRVGSTSDTENRPRGREVFRTDTLVVYDGSADTGAPTSR